MFSPSHRWPILKYWTPIRCRLHFFNRQIDDFLPQKLRFISLKSLICFGLEIKTVFRIQSRANPASKTQKAQSWSTLTKSRLKAYNRDSWWKPVYCSLCTHQRRRCKSRFGGGTSWLQRCKRRRLLWFGTYSAESHIELCCELRVWWGESRGMTQDRCQ